MLDAKRIREAVFGALPFDTSFQGNAPEPQGIFVPSTHRRALQLESSLVVGGRGVGKTFWCSAIISPQTRNLLGETVAELAATEVHPGFSETPRVELYPSADVFRTLLERGFSPYNIWRGVLARWAHAQLQEHESDPSWQDTLTWVVDDPEKLDRRLSQLDLSLKSRNKFGLILFDALDRLALDWRTMDTIIRDLMRVVLSLKPYGKLRGKIFLREDHFHHRRIADFPDASKLTATRTELTWELQDLHGLLWHYCCNARDPHGKILRAFVEQVVGRPPKEIKNNIWSIDRETFNDSTLRALFHVLAGKYMGKDARRGNTYLWSVGHLADGRGQTSPRSYLAALRGAAEDSLQNYADHGHPLHFESIKRGVVAASKIRIEELAEDYPWVKTLMAPLKGKNVPCEKEDVIGAWQDHYSSPSEAVAPGDEEPRLPPEHLDQGWFGVIQDLADLGVFDPLNDGRLNMPDLYRVGFGLGRHGGVKPSR